MKKAFFPVLLLVLGVLFAHMAPARAGLFDTCSVRDGLSVDCYSPRQSPVLRVALVYYGKYWSPADLRRFGPLLTKRFEESTRGVLKIQIVRSKVMPFKNQMPANYRFNGISDPDRLQRIWYWKEVGTGLGEEISSEFRKSEDKKSLEEIDLVLAVTEGQFDGNGFAASGIAVVEHPREIGWGLLNGGSTEILTDYKIADVLIHEIGHSLSIGHAADQCDRDGMSTEQRAQCCARSPSQNDVMSYCRNREESQVNEFSFNKFEACTLNIIQSRVRPAILSGGKRRIPELIHCD